MNHCRVGWSFAMQGRTSGCDSFRNRANRASRREAITLGALGLGGLTLPGLLRAEAAAGPSRSQKAVIMIYMVGAPPHQDM
jgi:hypothetical protein